MTSAKHRPTEKLIERLESAEVLDRPASKIQDLLQPKLRSPAARGLLSGTPIGHPAHPSLVAVPIGCWTSALLLDLTGDRKGARRLIGAGILAFPPTALTGWSDWVDTGRAERRVGLVHAVVNGTAWTLYLRSWMSRRAGRNASGFALSLLAGGILGFGGWLGGHLAYRMGVGVDTNAFDPPPLEDWTEADGPLPEEGAVSRVVAGGNPVAVVRRNSTLRALGDRCSHRGGPLSEGSVDGSCITCPWHGSSFDLETGGPVKGPASAPQPVYEVQEGGTGLRLRRAVKRSLQANATRG